MGKIGGLLKLTIFAGRIGVLYLPAVLLSVLYVNKFHLSNITSCCLMDTS